MNEIQAALASANLRTDEIPVVKYLCQGKVAVHRVIVAFLYDRDEASETGWVWPEEVIEHVRTVLPREDYMLGNRSGPLRDGAGRAGCSGA